MTLESYTWGSDEDRDIKVTIILGREVLHELFEVHNTSSELFDIIQGTDPLEICRFIRHDGDVAFDT